MAKKAKRVTFHVPNLGAKHRKGVKDRWRKQRGEDNKLRVEKKGHGKMPKIGYKKSIGSRYLLRSGLFETIVHNEKELFALKGRDECLAIFAHDVSERKRLTMQKLANTNGIRIKAKK